MSFQLGTNMLDALVLAIVSEEDAYGYLISQQIKKVADLKESTLYPVLKRLQGNGYLTTYDQPYQGRNRRYYKITEEGLAKYQAFIEEWYHYRDNIDLILLKKGELER